VRSLAPRPVLLALTLLLVAGAIAFVELRFNTASPDNTQAAAEPSVDQASESATEPSQIVEDQTAAERIASKETEFPRAKEIANPTGFINTDGTSIGESLGKKVILLDFWAYSCFNCKNTQPYLNAWHEKYEDDGLLIIGVHKPEFEFEKDPANVEKAVKTANIRYPVVLDNNDATWNAYDQHYWPAWYLIDADGFIQYKHFGEGAYEETEEKIQELLSEKDRVLN
jgi:thiol-disulfide isomerase/thioredoxin